VLDAAPKSVRSFSPFEHGSASPVFSQPCHASCASFWKKCRLSGQRVKLGTLVSRCKFDMMDLRLCGGLRGIPFFFLDFEIASRDSSGM
jgi:hypothetical protein